MSIEDSAHILIVEDDSTQAKLLKQCLEKHDFHVSATKDPKRALARIRKIKPDVVLSNIVMSEVDGCELCKQIKADRKLKDVAVILLTSLADPKDILRVLECGADNFSVKPFVEKSLVSCIQTTLNAQDPASTAQTEKTVVVALDGNHYDIPADPQSILKLLLTSYDTSIQKNLGLLEVQNVLRTLHQELEENLELRTAAMMVDNEGRKRSEEELLKRNMDLEILNATTQAVHRSLDIEEVYEIALDAAMAFEYVDMVCIYWVDRDKNEAVIQAQRNLPEDYLRRAGTIPYPKGVTWKVINTGEIENIQNVKKDPNIGPAGRALGHHSGLGIPIISEEKVIGVMWFFSIQEHEFYERETEILSSIGNQIAVAIAKARLYDELARKSRYENIVSEVTRSVHKSIDLQEVLGNAVEAMSENIVGAENVSIYLVEGNEAVMKSHRGYPDWFIERVKTIPYPIGFTWATIIEGEPRYVPDVDEDTSIGPAGRKVGTKSYVSMPLRIDNESIGCININSYQKNAFDAEELRLLDIVARQIEVAIINARQADALRENERRLAEAQRIAGLGNWDWNVETNELWWSDEVYRIFGLSPQGFDDNYETFLNTVHPDDREFVLKSVDESIHERKHYSIDHRIVLPTGEEKTVHEEAEVSWDDDGIPVRMIGTVHDISESKRVEEEIRKLNLDLEDRVRSRTSELLSANDELEAFSYSVSHDLRAPLRAINGFADAVLEEYEDRLDAEGQKYLNYIADSARRMGSLIDGLLSFSRVGREKLEMVEIDMYELAQTVCVELRMRDTGCNCDLKIKPLPPARGDRILIHQVLENLLSNAVKFTAQCEHPTIEIEGVVEGEYVHYSVKDNGAGFDEEYVEKLFAVFSRLHSKYEFEGSGVGLAIVQRIIGRHGGSVWAEGKIAEGATFHFTLPLAERTTAQGEE